MRRADALRHNADFRRLWVSQTVSEVGAQGTVLVIPLLVLSLGHSAFVAGLVGTVAAATRLALRLPSGVVVDRVDRRRLMMLCEAVRAGAMTALAVCLLCQVGSLAVVMAVAVVEAAGYVFFSAAERAALRHIVTAPQLPAAASSNEARVYIAGVVGPSLGGLLFGVTRALPFLVDAAGYLYSLSAVARVRRPLQDRRDREPGTPGRPRQTVTRSLAEGWRFVVGDPFLRAMAVIAPLLNLAFVGSLFVAVLALHRAGESAAVIGICQALIAAGGLLGAVVAPRLIRALAPGRLVVLLCWVMTAGVTACAVLPAGLWSVAPLPLLTLLVPAVNSTFFAYQSQVTPDHVHGRVITVLIFLSTAVSPLAPALTGFLVQYAGAATAFLSCAVFLALAATVAWRSPGVRAIRLAAEV